MNGYMYILKCSNNTYYVGSTKDLDRRFQEHEKGLGSNYTKKHLPVELVYYEMFDRIDRAFYREHQVKRWSSKKKIALIEGDTESLVELSRCKENN